MMKQFLAGMMSRAQLANGNEEQLANNKAYADALAFDAAQLGDAGAARVIAPVAPTAETGGAGTGAISLTTAGAAATENFNSLAATGTSSTLPTGWYILETGTAAAANGVYTAGTGSSNTGDTFSFGTAAGDRALGSVLSGTNAPSFGAQFTNGTGSTLGSLQVAFTGEQWRFGGAHATVADKLNFQISFDATSLSTGTWVDVDSLDFGAPITTGTAGPLDGNAAANRTAIAATISGLSIASGATFWIRFVDLDATGSDDGLAIDDFSITPIAASAPTPGVLTVADVSIAEGNSGTTDMVFTVTRANGSQGAVDVTYTITNTTTDGSDFGAGFVSTATVSFADGQTSAQIHVPLQGDTSYEANETFSLALSAPTGGATLGAHSTATGTITNDDAAPAGTLSIGNASLTEGDTGDTDMVFTVSRADGSVGAVSATWTVTLGSGTGFANAGDFGASYVATGTVSFADGATTAEVHIPIHGDVTYEPNETFTVTLSAPTGGAALGTTTGTGTITNNDPAPPPANIWINEIHYDNSSTDVGEAIEIAGVAGTDLTGYKLVLYNGTNTPTAAPTYGTTTLSGTIDDESNGYGAISFAYAVNGLQNGAADGIALVAPDGTVIQFLSYGGTITAADGLAAGRTSTDIGVSESPAPGVGFSLQLTGTGSTYNDFTWQNPADDNFGTINAGQSFLPAVGTSHIRVEDASAAEGNSGTTNISFTVHRAGGQAAAASVNYTVVLDGDANAADLGAAAVMSGTVSFAIDEFTKTITIPIQGDTVGEHNETFHVVLGATTGDAVVDRGTATGTITNDDPLPLLIGEIQGEGHRSAYVGQTVIASGIVTAVDTNGFYLQDPTGDGNSATSDGIFVFTSTTPTVAVGDAVQATGAVAEFVGAAGSLSLTQINLASVAIGTHGNTLPNAVLIGEHGELPPPNWIDDDGLTSYDPATDGIDFWESLEGMRVTIENPLVVSNTTSFGETDVVASLGVGATGVNDRGGITISPNGTGEPADFNPEKIQIDDDSGIFAGFNPNYSIGDHLSSVTGILNYGFANYEVIVTEAVTLDLDVTLTKEQTALQGDATHLSLATYNVENLDSSDNKFDILASNIVYNLRAPDIIALQEIQDTDGAGGGSDLSGTVTAQGLIDAIFAASGLHYAYIEVAPTTAGTTGGEPGGNIRNGYLYNLDRVGYVAGSAELIAGSAYNGSRNPLVASWTFNGRTITTIDVHSTSRGGSEDLWGDSQPPADAGDAARTAQAATIKAYINDHLATDPNLNIAVLGDWNGFYFEDAQLQLTDPAKGGVLTNLNTLLPEQERYSYLFNGNAQQIDNILVTSNLLGVAQYDAVHLNSQFGAAGRPTDHDPQVALFTFGPAATNDLSRTVENATVVIDVRANDANPNATIATIAGMAASVGVPVTLPSGATVTLGADGQLTYNPNGAYDWLVSVETAAATGASNGFAIETFAYTLAGGGGASVEVRVSGVDTPGDHLLGTAGADTITGTAAADYIDPGAGADTMSGGLGDDIYIVDNSADSVIEQSGQGNDTVRASASFTLVGYVENLVLTGGSAINGTGNSLANVLTGNSAANTLNGGDGSDTIDGGDGADTMIGGFGDDSFYVDQVGDLAVEGGGQGTDTVYASITYALTGQYIERLILTGGSAINGTGNSLANVLVGNAAANTLDGGDGNDIIDGFGGADTMIGGLGDDTFYVDQLGDLVVEGANGGYDTIRATISYTLTGQYVEALLLKGDAAINGTGNKLDNTLTGNVAANTLNGGEGNDTIDGGEGADTMNGGLGDDVYFVDQAGDVAVELNGQGTDTVNASVTYSLVGQFIENLVLTGGNAINGTGNSLANVLTGNSAANTLSGGDGNDTIDGGAGADTMIGGIGDDRYTVDNAGDVVIEAGGSGTDSVSASVSFSLAGQYIENLTLTGGNAINATGNSLANILTGNSAANVLSGADGNDALRGGLGADTLTGGNGSDGFWFDTALGGGNIDTITDFSVPADTIYLDNNVFTALGGNGTLSANAFVLGTTAQDADDRIVYDSATGNIYYDADGVGGAAAVQFAKVTAGTALTRADFEVATGLGPQNMMASVQFVLGSDAILADDGGSAAAGTTFTGSVSRADLLHEVASHRAVASIADLFGGDLGTLVDAMVLDGDFPAIDDGAGLLPAIAADAQHLQLVSSDWARDPVL
ncbi:MAG: Calx-beta domain-containing protein [Pseudomonadota bacterium]